MLVTALAGELTQEPPELIAVLITALAGEQSKNSAGSDEPERLIIRNKRPSKTSSATLANYQIVLDRVITTDLVITSVYLTLTLSVNDHMEKVCLYAVRGKHSHRTKHLKYVSVINNRKSVVPLMRT